MNHHHAPADASQLAHDVVVLGDGAAARAVVASPALAQRRVLLTLGPLQECTPIARGLRLTVDGRSEHARTLVLTRDPRPGEADPRGSDRVRAAATPEEAAAVATGLGSALTEEDAADALSSHAHEAWPDIAQEGFWEQLYSGTHGRWSGRPNDALVAALEGLPREGTAMDLGCGEGADAIWLAGQGWDTLGVDVSATAVARAERAAEAAGVGPERLRFTADGLAGLDDAARFDLVTVSYLHSPAQEDRASALAHAGRLVAPGGHLFVLSHVLDDAAGTTPDGTATGEEVTGLGLTPSDWETTRAATIPRQALAPGGAVVDRPDRVLLLRRTRP